jgi:hypothetical protein
MATTISERYRNEVTGSPEIRIVVELSPPLTRERKSLQEKRYQPLLKRAWQSRFSRVWIPWPASPAMVMVISGGMIED